MRKPQSQTKKKKKPPPRGIPLRRKWACAAWSPAPKMKPLWAQSCWMKACQPCSRSISCGETGRREWTLSVVVDHSKLSWLKKPHQSGEQHTKTYHLLPQPFNIKPAFSRLQPCPHSFSPQSVVVWAFHTLLKSTFKSTWGQTIQTHVDTWGQAHTGKTANHPTAHSESVFLHTYSQ